MREMGLDSNLAGPEQETGGSISIDLFKVVFFFLGGG